MVAMESRGEPTRYAVARRPVAGALSLLSWALASACGAPTTAGVADEALTRIDADNVTYGMRSYLTAEGVRSGEVMADSAYMFYRDSSVVHLFTVEMTVFNERGLEHARVVADSGRLDERSERMVAWGNVVVTLPEGNRRIETSELHYDPPAESIWSDSSVVITQDGRVTRGSSFRSSLTFENWSIGNPVGAATLRPPAGGGP